MIPGLLNVLFVIGAWRGLQLAGKVYRKYAKGRNDFDEAVISRFISSACQHAVAKKTQTSRDASLKFRTLS